jgi:DNA-binding response OmpR family regulator
MPAVVLASHEEDVGIIESFLTAQGRRWARLDYSAGEEAATDVAVVEPRPAPPPHDATPDIVLLAKVDLMLLEGAVRHLKLRHDRQAIILVARNVNNGRVRDVIARSIKAGADDFVESTAVPAELLLRLEALTERARHRGRQRLRTFGDLELDYPNRRLRSGDHSVSLTTCEFSIFLSLLGHAGTPVTRAVIQQDIARLSRSTTYNIIDVYILYLRRKLAQLGCRCFIRTTRGVGYALVYEGGAQGGSVEGELSNGISGS